MTSAATATDPSVSPDPRGSHSEGSCEGVSGGVCQAVTNSGASTGPDANIIAPLVAARSTSNATVSSGTTGDAEPATAEQDQPGTPGQDSRPTPPAPTAPGSSANSGGPTVPGASSWTMASATLDCAGEHGVLAARRAPRPRAATAPTALNGATGRVAHRRASPPPAPPAPAASPAARRRPAPPRDPARSWPTSSRNSRTTPPSRRSSRPPRPSSAPRRPRRSPPARARPQSREDRRRRRDRGATRRARRPPRPPSWPRSRSPTPRPRWSQSTRDRAVRRPGLHRRDHRRHLRACRATRTPRPPAPPPRAAARSPATRPRCCCPTPVSAPRATRRTRTASRFPALPDSGETGSNLLCPDAGCTGKVSGKASVNIEQGGLRSTSTGAGNTACDGTGPCQAGIRITASAATTAPGVQEENRFAATAVTVAASCDNGTDAGCADPRHQQLRRDGRQGRARQGHRHLRRRRRVPGGYQRHGVPGPGPGQLPVRRGRRLRRSQRGHRQGRQRRRQRQQRLPRRRQRRVRRVDPGRSVHGRQRDGRGLLPGQRRRDVPLPLRGHRL